MSAIHNHHHEEDRNDRRAPAGGAAAAAPVGGVLAGPLAPTSISTRWALVNM
jgi:hypothetical protein